MNMGLIPEKGWLYSLSFDRDILFTRYSISDGKVLLQSGQEFSMEEQEEIHCFDETAEYRYLSFGGEVVEMRLTEEEEKSSGFVILREEQYLEDSFVPDGKSYRLIVVNRFAYQENDSLYLKEYRLGGVKEI